MPSCACARLARGGAGVRRRNSSSTPLSPRLYTNVTSSILSCLACRAEPLRVRVRERVLHALPLRVLSAHRPKQATGGTCAAHPPLPGAAHARMHTQPLRVLLTGGVGDAVRQALPIMEAASGFTLDVQFVRLAEVVATVLRQKDSPPGAPAFDAWSINNAKVRDDEGVCGCGGRSEPFLSNLAARGRPPTDRRMTWSGRRWGPWLRLTTEPHEGCSAAVVNLQFAARKRLGAVPSHAQILEVALAGMVEPLDNYVSKDASIQWPDFLRCALERASRVGACSNGQGGLQLSLATHVALSDTNRCVQCRTCSLTLRSFLRQSSAVFNGSLLGIPQVAAFKHLLYRRDVLARAGLAPPNTWHELVEVARRLNGTDMDGGADAREGRSTAQQRGRFGV